MPFVRYVILVLVIDFTMLVLLYIPHCTNHLSLCELLLMPMEEFTLGTHIYWSACAVIIMTSLIKWKHFPRHWSFVRGIHRLPVNSPHKGQWRGGLIYSLICAWINGWVNNREAVDLRRHWAHCDVNVLITVIWQDGFVISIVILFPLLIFPPSKTLTMTLTHPMSDCTNLVWLASDFPTWNFCIRGDKVVHLNSPLLRKSQKSNKFV